MYRRPPTSKRTDTLFPYTTLVRSRNERINICLARHPRRGTTVEDGMAHYFEIKKNKAGEFVAYFKYNSEPIFWTEGYSSKASAQNAIESILKNGPGAEVREAARSEERRVGKGCVSKCRSRWSASH